MTHHTIHYLIPSPISVDLPTKPTKRQLIRSGRIKPKRIDPHRIIKTLRTMK
jgi:hypothetical protein